MKKVSVEQKKYILEDVFKVEEAYLRYEKFNGEMSGTVRRISLERGDSVSILIYNTITNKIILIRQFRYPSYKSGNGWLIETIAGIVDKGEKPEESARREVQEETGLTIKTLEHITTFYPSPGGSSERVFLYYSEVSRDQTVDGEVGGLACESEDIKSHELTLDEALGKIKSGEIMDAKTIIGIQWLENRQLKQKTTGE
ncbi:MAG TPA: NUDIX hydrolase [Anaerolineales bacterium]|nr:NUDIX hydrolase [Anaerolineales bacterium]